jgi:hypothetical protein
MEFSKIKITNTYEKKESTVSSLELLLFATREGIPPEDILDDPEYEFEFTTDGPILWMFK